MDMNPHYPFHSFWTIYIPNLQSTEEILGKESEGKRGYHLHTISVYRAKKACDALLMYTQARTSSSHASPALYI